METKTALSNVTVSETDVSEQAKPEFLPLTPDESQALQNGVGFLRQVQSENIERETIAQNNIQASLWRLANKYGVDLSAYEFNYDKQSFVKKG